MSVGIKIRQIRLRSGKTQREVCQGTGLAVSYLSRLENGRINPSIQTLQRLARSLKVPISSFFDADPVLEQGDRCPVSLDGSCILDQIFVSVGRPLEGREAYTREQLELLRLCNYLLHSGNKKIRVTLRTLLRALAGSVDKR